MPPLLLVGVAALMTALALAWVLRPLRARRGARSPAPLEDEEGSAEAPGAASRASRDRRRAALAVVVTLPLFAAGLYALLGEPGAASRAGTPDAGAALDTLPAAAARDELVAHLARQPRDARALVLLARLDFGEDRYADAAEGFRRALAADAKVERDPAIWCEYADALGMAQGGSLAGPPRAALQRALARNPAFGQALEMAGSAAYEAGDYAEAARHWRALAAQMPEATPAQRELLAAIARAELLGAGARR